MNERDKELVNQVTWYADLTLTELSRYAAIIRADEREAIIEWIRNNYQDHNIASLCDAIRARGNT